MQNLDPVTDLGEPGSFPFTRGVYPTMYLTRPWTMRQYAGFSTAADSNRRYHQLIAAGTTGLSVAFDLPTQMGYDSDAEQAGGEVGKVGVAIDSLEDMRLLFDGIRLDQVSTSMTINAPAALLLLLYQLVAEEQGMSPAAISGTIQNDILKEYIARGTYIYPPQPSLRLVADTFAYCRAEIPRWNTISISGYHMAEAGATPVQEIAFTLANAREYVRTAIDVRAGGRRVRAAAVVLLRGPHHAAGGGSQVPRGPAPVGAHHAGRVRRAGPAVADAPVPHPDGRCPARPRSSPR